MKPMITIQTLLLSFLLAELALHADCQKRCWFAKRTRNGEECSGPMKHLSPELARYVLPEVRMIGHATDTGHEQIGNHRAFVPVNFRTIQINCIIGTSQEGCIYSLTVWAGTFQITGRDSAGVTAVQSVTTRSLSKNLNTPRLQRYFRYFDFCKFHSWKKTLQMFSIY